MPPKRPLAVALCSLFLTAALHASPITYIFHFQSADGPSPTGGFTYDSATGKVTFTFTDTNAGAFTNRYYRVKLK